jgi:hypothetical protein
VAEGEKEKARVHEAVFALDGQLWEAVVLLRFAKDVRHETSDDERRVSQTESAG